MSSPLVAYALSSLLPEALRFLAGLVRGRAEMQWIAKNKRRVTATAPKSYSALLRTIATKARGKTF